MGRQCSKETAYRKAPNGWSRLFFKSDEALMSTIEKQPLLASSEQMPACMHIPHQTCETGHSPPTHQQARRQA